MHFVLRLFHLEKVLSHISQTSAALRKNRTVCGSMQVEQFVIEIDKLNSIITAIEKEMASAACCRGNSLFLAYDLLLCWLVGSVLIVGRA